jgi:hypothetical protein
MFSLRSVPNVFGRCSKQAKQRILRKDYDHKGSVAKKIISSRDPQGARRQDDLIGGKPPVVK